MYNLVDLKMQRRYGTVDDNESSRFFGFSAIHYAAYFGAKQAIEFLAAHELKQLTTQPIHIKVPIRNEKIYLPAGLSYQSILALQGKFSTLKEQIAAHGLI